MFAGVYRTTLDIGFPSLHCSFVYGTFEGFGLLILSYASNSKGCRNGILIAGVLAIVGVLMALFPTLFDSVRPLKSLGLGLIRVSISAQPTLILSIVSEITTLRIIQIVFCLSCIMHNIGRIFSSITYTKIHRSIDPFNGIDPELYPLVFILFPCCLISFFLSFLVNNSPRFFIENNFNKAE
jgi:hypothetical protein